MANFISARQGKHPKVLLIFDTPQNKEWLEKGTVTKAGIESLLKKFIEAGVSFDDVSAVCLADEMNKPKANDYKMKAEYVKELIETYAYNVVIPVGATAFEKIVGFKGAQKYFGKTLYSQLMPSVKVLPCPNPAQAKYDPSIIGVMAEMVKQAVIEKEFPEIREIDRIPTKYEVLDTMEKVNKFFDYYNSPAVKAFAYDLETTGFHFKLDKILTIQFTHRVGYSYLIPTDWYNYWTPQEWQQIIGKIRYLFNIETKTVIGHNKKFDDKFIYHHWKVPVRKKNVFDTMIASFCCNENSPNDLKHLACTLTDMGDYELELDQFKDKYCKENKVKKKSFTYDLIPFEILSHYALCDTDATFRLYEHYLKELAAEEQEDVFAMVMRFTYMLTIMEINGWPVDVLWAKEYKGILEGKIAELQAELKDSPQIQKVVAILAARKLEAENKKRKKPLEELKEPFEFNFNSAPQKKTLFFEVMGLPILKYTKTKDENGKRTTPAADKEVLDQWCEDLPEHEDFLLKIKALGMFEKVKNTYVLAVLNKSVDGRIHPTYKAIGAKTGRLSSAEPNLQNIQSKADDKLKKVCGIDTSKDVKKLFCAGEGKIMLGADLSAAEMRYACVASGDRKLIDIFVSGVDIHCSIAKELFDYIPRDISDDDLKKEYKHERDIAKTVQFLSLYGGGADALAKKAKIPKDKAQAILDNYFKKYAGVDAYIKNTIKFVEEYGYSLSLLGRKRRVPAIDSTDEFERAKAVRQAVNATIQSVASDGLLISACNLLDKIEAENLPITLLGPIHDALYAEVAEEDKLMARDLIIENLAQFPIPAPIPMLSDCEWGKRWSEFSEDFADSYMKEGEDEDEEEELLEAA